MLPIEGKKVHFSEEKGASLHLYPERTSRNLMRTAILVGVPAAVATVAGLLFMIYPNSWATFFSVAGGGVAFFSAGAVLISVGGIGVFTSVAYWGRYLKARVEENKAFAKTISDN